MRKRTGTTVEVCMQQSSSNNYDMINGLDGALK